MLDGLFRDDPRLLTGQQDNEDAAILRFPPGKALVQTVDFFTPIVNDPYWFGQIAAANSLSDVYAMGGEPYAAMNIVCFPVKTLDKALLRRILEGGRDKVLEAGAVMAGGHSVVDEELKYGLAVSGVIDPERFATNRGLQAGDALLLTKPLGTGVLATGLKARLPGCERWEALLYRWAARLNTAGGRVVRELGLRAATDVTGFGLGGHVLEMAQASDLAVELWLDNIPFIPEAVELAGLGMLPAGSHDNRNFCKHQVRTAGALDPVLLDLVFDAQTSGGMVLAVPAPLLAEASRLLESLGDLSAHIGQVLPAQEAEVRLTVRATRG